MCVYKLTSDRKWKIYLHTAKWLDLNEKPTEINVQCVLN